VTSGRKLLEVVETVKMGLAIELLCNTQGLEFLRPLKTSPALEQVHKLVRKHVLIIEEDRTFHKDIENLTRLIETEEIIQEVETITGPLA
jgi:histidine ammonia-lyase